MAAPCAPEVQDFEELAGQVFDCADADGDGQVTKLDLFEFTTDNQVRLACHVKLAGPGKAPLTQDCPDVATGLPCSWMCLMLLWRSCSTA